MTRSLEAAARDLASGDSDRAQTARAVDRFVTSRDGFRQLLKGRYRIDPAGDEWDKRRLADELTRAVGDRAAAEMVAGRAVDAGRVVSFSDGPARRDVLRELKRTAPICAGPSPCRPVTVAVTRHPQRQLELPVLGRVEVRAVDVRAGDESGEERTVLLLHGHGSRLEENEALIDALSDAARVIAFDLPGCGYSEKPDVDYSILGYEPVIVALLDELEVSRCVVAGGGLGGNLALRLSYRYPLIVEHAVAWSIAGWGDTKPFLSGAARALAGGPAFAFWAAAKRQLDEQLREGLEERERLFEEELEYRREVYEPNYQRAYFQIAADQVGTSMLENAGAIEPPVTLLAGEHDRGRLNIRGAVERLAEAMGIEANLVDSGYGLVRERPEAVASHILAALEAP